MAEAKTLEVDVSSALPRSHECDIGNSDRGASIRLRLATGVPVVDELVTRSTGKALPGQRPVYRLGGTAWWLMSTAMLFALVTTAIAVMEAMSRAGWTSVALVPVLAVLLVAITGRLRAQQVIFGHHAVHNSLSKQYPWINRFVRHFGPAVALAQNPDDYKRDHLLGHHRLKVFTTATDPDASYLMYLGFRPGMTREESYRRLLKTIVSPRFHSSFARARLSSSLVTASWSHRMCVMAWLLVLVSLALALPWWMFFVAVVLPAGPLYHVSALLQFLTEHRWMVTSEGPRDREDYASRSVGRFAVVAPPPKESSRSVMAWQWACWTVRMIPEALVRLGVWVGDLPAHDHHHVAGMLGHRPQDWDAALFERQRAIDEGDLHRLAHREVYGLKEALDWVFDGLANAKV